MSKTLGTIIAEERKKKGLSQEKFAEQMKCTRQMVSRWELDDAKPRTDNIKRICKVLEIPIDELIGDNNSKNSNISDDSNPIKVKKFNFRKLSIIIGIIITLLVVLYGGYSIYKYTLLNNIYSKVAQYMDVENYYFKKDLYSNNELKTSTEVWYKNGLYKIIDTSYFESMETYSIKYFDLINKYRYTVNEEEKTYEQEYLANTTKYENGAYMYSLFPLSITDKGKEEFDKLSKKINLVFSKIEDDKLLLIINNEELFFDKENYFPIIDNINVNINGNNDVLNSNIRYNVIFNTTQDEDVKIPDYYTKVD